MSSLLSWTINPLFVQSPEIVHLFLYIFWVIRKFCLNTHLVSWAVKLVHHHTTTRTKFNLSIFFQTLCQFLLGTSSQNKECYTYVKQKETINTDQHFDFGFVWTALTFQLTATIRQKWIKTFHLVLMPSEKFWNPLHIFSSCDLC